MKLLLRISYPYIHLCNTCVNLIFFGLGWHFQEHRQRKCSTGSILVYGYEAAWCSVSFETTISHPIMFVYVSFNEILNVKDIFS